MNYGGETVKFTKDNFKQLARNSRLSSFSEDALESMFDFYEETDTDVDYDPVAFDCEWTEFTENEFIEQYSYLLDKEEEEEEDIIEILVSELETRTTIFELNNGNYLILDF